MAKCAEVDRLPVYRESAGPMKCTGVELERMLGQRRWIWRLRPFPHVVAYDVFNAETARRLDASFRRVLAETHGEPYMAEHDIDGRTIDPDIADQFDPLFTRPWHDLLARAVGVAATGHVTGGVHHHRIGSNKGFPHNDLNPGWFLGSPIATELLVAGAGINYKDGTMMSANGHEPVETIRAAAALYYLANPRWEPGDGGSTGLFTSADDSIEAPSAEMPPINNSLLLFECTPLSFHGFVMNRRHPRNSIIMWLHRPKDDVTSRWGEAAIVQYGVPAGRKQR